MSSSSEFKVTPLEGSVNYRTWKFSMRMVLMAKDLWGVVNGSEVKSRGDAATEWEKRNQKALAYISLSLTPIEQHHILDCTAAKAAWDILEKLYEGKGRNRKFLLMEQLFKLTMDDHDATTMDSYLRTMKDKMSELAAIGITLDKEVKLALIFNGITERFRYLVVTLEQQDLDFDELTARLIEEAERYSGTPESGSAYSARRAVPLRSNGMKCYYCGQPGHVKAVCEVRKYRMEKYGDGKDENKLGDSGAALSTTRTAVAF